MSEVATTTKEAEISLELVQYCDDFADFNEDCAFLCDAFACLAANNEDLDERSIRGLERHAYSLKQRVGEFKERLTQLKAHQSNLSG